MAGLCLDVASTPPPCTAAVAAAAVAAVIVAAVATATVVAGLPPVLTVQTRSRLDACGVWPWLHVAACALC